MSTIDNLHKRVVKLIEFKESQRFRADMVAKEALSSYIIALHDVLSLIEDDAGDSALVEWYTTGKAISKLSDDSLIKAAYEYAANLRIDSPVYALIVEMCERLESTKG